MVTDTAGLRETEDAIEAEGVIRAQQAATDSNIVLAVADASQPHMDASLMACILPAEEQPTKQAGSFSHSDRLQLSFSSRSICRLFVLQLYKGFIRQWLLC